MRGLVNLVVIVVLVNLIPALAAPATALPGDAAQKPAGARPAPVHDAPFDQAHDVTFDQAPRPEPLGLSSGRRPGTKAHDVTILSDATWYTATLTLGNLVISNSAVLTLAGSPGTRVTLDELQVTAGAGLIVSGAAIITAANVTVEAGASLSANGLGYGASSGPGAGEDGIGLGNQAGGGGHGGRGGAGWEGGFYAVYLPLVMRGLDEVGKLSSWSGSGDPDRAKSGDGGQPYGDAAEPGLMGSGGGSAGAAVGGG